MVICISIFLFLFCSIQQGHTQMLCDGNLGINIFSEGDFGSGPSNIITNNPGIAPGYSYQAQARSPRDGEYVITNNMVEWNFSYDSWIRIEDNSPDPDGYMMVVNASFTPGLFYEQIVDGLCENTLYEFSADIINVIRSGVAGHIEPNVAFLIDDVVVFNTGDIPQNEMWNQYGFTFTTDVGQTSIKLSLRNNAPGGIGNDLALDNISFRACGPSSFITAEKTLFLCEDGNEPIDLIAELMSSGQVIQWQFSRDSITWDDLEGENDDTTPHALYQVGSYYYRYMSAGSNTELANEKCRVISDVLEVRVLGLEYTVVDTICFAESYQFGNRQLVESGMYIEEFVSIHGCDSIVDLDLHVLPREMLSITNDISHPSCPLFADGSITINLNNGDLAPYSFAINEVPTQNNTFVGLSEGLYAITITNRSGCRTIQSVTLEDPPAFIVQLPDDITVQLGDEVDILVDANQEINDISWNRDLPEGSSFAFVPIINGEYRVDVTNTLGCRAFDIMNITIDIENTSIYVPNVFGPNFSLDNTFRIGSKENLITSVVAQIYDRWGNLIHGGTFTPDEHIWDGRSSNRELVAGAYVYRLELTLLNGEVLNLTGSVTLLY